MPIIILVVGIILVLWLVEWYYKKHWSKNLSVDIRFQPQPAVEGGEAWMTETIRNEKKLVLPLLHVKFQTNRACDFHEEENVAVSDQTYKNDIFSLAGYSQVKRTLVFTCRKRGVYQIDHVDLVTGFLFYQELNYDRRDADTSLVVYPSCVDLEQLDDLANQMAMSSKARSRLITDPFAFAGIREYTPHDPLKTVNWKASAHTGGLQVNVYDKTAGLPIVLLVNLQRPFGRMAEDILEESIRIAVTWADRLLKEGLFVSLQTNLDDDRPDEDRGEGWDEINTRMAMIDLKKKGRSFSEWMETDIIPFIREDVCYGVISYDETPDMNSAVDSLAAAAGRIWLVRPALVDSERVYHDGRVSILERWVEPHV